MDEKERAALNERFDSLTKLENIVTHKDWREAYLYFADRAKVFGDEMENASSWDHFIVARGLKRYTEYVLMKLPEIVRAEKDALEVELAAPEMGDVSDDSGVPEYEQD